jgi:hypothetical protein
MYKLPQGQSVHFFGGIQLELAILIKMKSGGYKSGLRTLEASPEGTAEH